jgi:diguanylate cyclase (GGDEF)-like protein/PAS domain S-box-containing protein
MVTANSPGSNPADGLEVAVLRNLLAQTTRAYDEKMAQLFAEKEMAQVTLASIGDGVLTTDDAGRVKYLNPVAEAMTGWSREEAAGRLLSEVFCLAWEGEGPDAAAPHDAAERSAVDQAVRRAVADGRSVRLGEGLILERRDGRRYAVESLCSPLRDHGVHAFRDATDAHDSNTANDSHDSHDSNNAHGANNALGARVVGVVLVFQDVSDKRLMALQLAHQAKHDELTGLLNRQAFDAHVQRCLDETRALGTTHALCYMDLDQFKLVNDACGHLAGDELLRRVSALLRDASRDVDLVARLGGDEFGVLLPRCSLLAAEEQMRKFQHGLQDCRFNWQDKSFAVAASIGVVPITRDFKSVAHLLSAADHACYVAKEKGRHRIQLYQEDDATFIRRHGEMSWVLRIQKALETDHFRLFCQRIHPLSAGAARGVFFEVLLRMIEEDGRVHLPSELIRAAERYGLMRSVDRWVIRACVQTLAAQPPPFLPALDTCAINLSAVSLSDEGLLGYVADELARAGVPAQKICFEITETAAIQNLQQAGRLISGLAALGIRFALDDFGTGMSSYSYLRDIPVSFLKIDGKFIKDIVNDPLDRAMVESINQVSHVMGIETIAEAVPGSAAVERLRGLGVDYAQGNWLAPPRPMLEVCAAEAAAAACGSA